VEAYQRLGQRPLMRVVLKCRLDLLDTSLTETYETRFLGLTLKLSDELIHGRVPEVLDFAKIRK
jgi:hypothetical protein